MAVPSALQPRIFAGFAKALRPAFAAVRFVGLDLSMEAKRRGAAITVPIQRAPDSSRVRDFTEGLTPTAAPTANNPTPSQTVVTLDQYKDRPVEFGSQERQKVIEGVLPSEIETAALDMASFINKAVFDQYKEIDNAIFIREPFKEGSTRGSELDDVKTISKRAAAQHMPSSGRVLLLHQDAYAEAQANSRLTDYDKMGLPPGMNELDMFRSRGYHFVQDQEAPLSEGTTGTATVNGAVSKGDTTVTMDGKSSGFDPKDGDVLFGGNTSSVDETSDSDFVGVVKSATGTVITLHEGANKALVDNARLETINGRQNLLVSPGAIQVAVRVPEDPADDIAPELASNANLMVAMDPVTKFPVVMLVWRGAMKVHVTFITLYGIVVPQPDRALRIVSA